MINPDDISQELMDDLNGKVQYIYNEVPTTVVDSTSPFVVCSVDTAIIDMMAYYYTVASIYVFVPNLSNGTHNGKKEKIVIDSISSIFPIKSEKYSFNTMPSIIPMGNDNKGYNVNKIQIETYIYKI